MAITIRPSEASDAAAIARVHVDSWRTTYPGIVPDDYLNSLLSYEQREEFWEELLTQGESTTFACVAEDTSGPVVGFASAGSERSGEAAYKGELYTIYILDSHQRQGIGSDWSAPQPSAWCSATSTRCWSGSWPITGPPAPSTKL